jgi:hypothetical protein
MLWQRGFAECPQSQFTVAWLEGTG